MPPVSESTGGGVVPPAKVQVDGAAFEVDQANVTSARTVQAWWRSLRSVRKAAAALLAQGAQLRRTSSVLATDTSAGFEDVLAKIQAKELIDSVVKLLVAVSGPDLGLLALSPRTRGSPRALEAAQQQQARKFLTAMMIKHHPDEVITDDKGNCSLETLEARLLCIAARMALGSAVALVGALDGLEAPEPGGWAVFRLRLNTFAFARLFLNESLRVLQVRQSRGVAISFLSSYGEAYRYLKDAERSHEDVLITAARQSLDKVKMGIVRVMGREQTEKHCQSVEQALDLEEPFVVLTPGDIKVPLPALGMPRRASSLTSGGGRPTSRSASTSPTFSHSSNVDSDKEDDMSVGSGSNSTRSSPGPFSARPRMASSSSSSSSSSPSSSPLPFAMGPELAGAATPAPAVPQALAGLLRNEHLAHEMMLDPTFKLEPKPKQAAGQPQEGPLAAQMAQVREAMEKVFWDRLVLALTPAVQETAADVVPGALVQLRFGGGQGSLFEATVEAVHAEGQTLDVAYVMDGMKERRPVADVRLKADPLDYEPLLALLDDVREKLADLTPKRKDLAAELQAKLDKQFLGQMARQGLLDAPTIHRLLTFVVQRLMALQAPLRAAETGAWFSGMEAQVQAAITSLEPGSSSSSSSCSSTLSPAFVRLLPVAFQTVFERIDETRRDIANAHVEMLRPFLAQHGVAYERQKFAERLRTGDVKFVNTQAWLHDVLAAPERAAHLAALARGDSVTHRTVMGEAFSYLLRLPVRLDNPVTAKLPETLLYDGRRLAELRDELDRLTVVAVYSTLLRQFLSNQQLRLARPAGEILASVETRLYTVLQDDHGVKLPQLVDEVVQAAKRVFAEAGEGAAMTNEQAATLRGVLNGTMSMDSPLFTLLFARLGEALGVYASGEEAAGAEVVARYGFRAFETQLATTGAKLHRVLEHSLAVHGELYSRLLKDEAAALLRQPATGTAEARSPKAGASGSTQVPA